MRRSDAASIPAKAVPTGAGTEAAPRSDPRVGQACLLIVGVLAMTFLPGIPVVSGLVVVSHSTQCPTHLGASVGKEHPIVAGALH